MINPVSFGLCAEEGKFQNYWSTTAMTTFLTALAPVYAGIVADRSTNYQFAAVDELVAGKTVRKLGLPFSSEKRTIVDVKQAA